MKSNQISLLYYHSDACGLTSFEVQLSKSKKSKKTGNKN